MAKKFELEKRALLTPKLFPQIIQFLDHHARLQKTFERFSVIFWNHPEAKPAEASPYDFRVRVTGNQGLFTLKFGDWRGGAREEYEFHFDLNELDAVVNIMRVWGHKWGTTTHVARRQYRYQSFDIVLDQYLDDGTGLLEIEKECQSQSDIAKSSKTITALMHKWHLKPLSKSAMVTFVRRLNAKQANYFDISTGDTERYTALWLAKLRHRR